MTWGGGGGRGGDERDDVSFSFLRLRHTNIKWGKTKKNKGNHRLFLVDELLGREGQKLQKFEGKNGKSSRIVIRVSVASVTGST